MAICYGSPRRLSGGNAGCRLESRQTVAPRQTGPTEAGAPGWVCGGKDRRDVTSLSSSSLARVTPCWFTWGGPSCTTGSQVVTSLWFLHLQPWLCLPGLSWSQEEVCPGDLGMQANMRKQGEPAHTGIQCVNPESQQPWTWGQAGGCPSPWGTRALCLGSWKGLSDPHGLDSCFSSSILEFFLKALVPTAAWLLSSLRR